MAEVHKDEAGDGDGYADVGFRADGLVGEGSPEDSPDGQEVGDRDHVGGGDGSEEMEVEEVGDAAASEAKDGDGEPVLEMQVGWAAHGRSKRALPMARGATIRVARPT